MSPARDVPRSTDYEFRLLLAGLDMSDYEDIGLILAGFDGAASIGGTSTELVEMVVTAPANDPLEAVMAAIDKLRTMAPSVEVIGLDQELVGISDIAELSGKSRETVRLYADGKRGTGGFPRPQGIVGDSVRVWRWNEVDTWLRQATGFEFPTTPVPSEVIDLVNSRCRRSAPQRRTARSRSPKAPVPDSMEIGRTATG